jgi:hypothetical protein
MALIIKDRVKEGTTSTGTGSISLVSASATFDAFESVMTNGDTTYYAIVHTSSGVDEWEVGLGTWNTGNTLSRTTVLAGSGGTSAVNFSAGTKDVFMTYPSAIAAYTDGSGDLSSLIGLGNHTTTDLAEGSNLYFNTGRIDSHLSGGTGVTYNAGVISIGQAVATTSNVAFNTVTLSGDITVPNLITSGNVDGRDVSVDGTKLDGIEAGATADQTITLSGDLTGSGTTSISAQIAANVVGANELNVTGNGTATQFLRSDGDGTFTWAVPTDTNTTYTAGTGLSLTGTTFANTDPDQTVSLTQGGATTISGTYPNFTISSTDTNTTYTAGTGLALTGTVFSNTITNNNQLTNGAAYVDNAGVDTHLNTGTATTGEVLSWTGTDYDWIAAGGGGTALELYAENPSSPTTPQATGLNSVAIGQNSRAFGEETVSLGNALAYAAAFRSVAIGYVAQVSGDYSVSIGTNNSVSGNYSVGIAGNAGSDQSTAIGTNSANNKAVTATGTGAMALGGSYASGSNSFAAAIANNTSSYGATGASSVAIGRLAKATGQDAIAIGDTTTASGTNAIAFGNAAVASATKSTVIGGDGNVASGSKSVAIGGYYAEAREECKIAFGGGYIGVGVATNAYQAGLLCMGAATTDATATVLRSSNAAASTTNQVILPNNSAYFFSGTIIARQSAATGTDVGAWEIKGAISREANAASTVLVKSTIDDFNVPTGWAVALTADTTNGGLAITVTGAAATNIRWVSTVTTSEVTY